MLTIEIEIITLKETQPADIRKVRNMHAPIAKDRKGWRGAGRGTEGNSSKEAVLRLEIHTLARTNCERGTPKRKLEGDITYSPAKKLHLIFDGTSLIPTPKPSDDTSRKSDNEGIGTPDSIATTKFNPH